MHKAKIKSEREIQTYIKTTYLTVQLLQSEASFKPNNFLYFQLMPTASCPFTGHHWEESSFISLLLPAELKNTLFFKT